MREYLDVIIDSPLAAEFTQSYRELNSLWDKEARRKLKAGRDIQRYAPNISGRSSGYVFLDCHKVDIKASVHTLSGYSAHADQKDLLNFVKRMRHKPKHIRIVHGDDEAKAELQGSIKSYCLSVRW